MRNSGFGGSMSTPGERSVSVVGDGTSQGTGSDQTGHALLAGSGAYNKPDVATGSTSTSSGSSWDTAKGFLNLVTGEVITSDKTTTQMRSELDNVSTATSSLNNAANDFRNGNNDLAVTDYRKAITAMDQDPNLARQDLHAKIDMAMIDVAGYVPFFGQHMQESIGAGAQDISNSVSQTGSKVGQALGHTTA
jgi:hypothetical protein